MLQVSYLPVVSCVDEPGAITTWRVEVGVVWRAKGAVEVSQPFPTNRNITVNLISEILGKKTSMTTTYIKAKVRLIEAGLR